MDMQKFVDMLGDASRRTRGDYHLTLGALTEAVRGVAGEMPVVFDDGASVGQEHSYRGYYDDLAFEPSNGPAPAAEVLAACERAATDTYEGYKGGDYTYAPNTPLWCAPYGCCGAAVVAVEERDGRLVLITKDVS